MKLLALSDRDVAQLLPPRDLVPAIEAAAREYEERSVVVPSRLHLEWNGNTLLAMPAATSAALGTKLVAVVPGNSNRGLPVTSGVMILNDAQTGLPVALLNAAELTARRTGAVGALGTRYMTPEDLDTVGIIGTGAQGAWQAIFTCCVRPIREVLYLARSARGEERFRAAVREHAPGVKITPCESPRELLAQARLIITATPSQRPVLPDDPKLLADRHFIAVGSFSPSMQELPDSVYRLAGALAIDSEAARHEVGDVIGPVARGILNSTDVYFIGQLLSGRRSLERRGVTVYKTAGMALYDLVAAQLAYGAARQRGLGRELEL
jgi:ornithine cyclodeaminase/alanine dehydrogenase-like protein (mu-crystallin family)